ncbi:DUF4259 domain-containing protein [Embleya sp. AB8]|uniref:DUF4259 domain-containing protein n=1 Tax=Embleya sp. AB8 TaxID=3156304 RepID=UPI003C70D650
MGTWGSGNFESDTAAEHLTEIIDRLVGEVAEAMAGDPVGLEPDDYWGVAVPCNLELVAALTESGYVADRLPSAEVIEGWKETFMAIWERTIDGLAPKETYKAERRATLIHTFDRLTQARTRAGVSD